MLTALVLLLSATALLAQGMAPRPQPVRVRADRKR